MKTIYEYQEMKAIILKISELEEWVKESYPTELTLDTLTDPNQLEVYQTIDQRCLDVIKSS